MAGISFAMSRGGSTDPVVAVGTEREGSPVLDAAVNIVRTAAGADAVQLPNSGTGAAPISVVVVPDPESMLDAPPANIFPAENGSIQGGAVDTPYSLPSMVVATFVAVSGTDWAVNLSAAPAATPPARTAESEAEAAAARAAAKIKSAKAKEEAAKAKVEAEAKAKAKAERAEKRDHEHRAEA